MFQQNLFSKYKGIWVVLYVNEADCALDFWKTTKNSRKRSLCSVFYGNATDSDGAYTEGFSDW
jgi:predicted acetyltransferase